MKDETESLECGVCPNTRYAASRDLQLCAQDKKLVCFWSVMPMFCGSGVLVTGWEVLEITWDDDGVGDEFEIEISILKKVYIHVKTFTVDTQYCEIGCSDLHARGSLGAPMLQMFRAFLPWPTERPNDRAGRTDDFARPY